MHPCFLRALCPGDGESKSGHGSRKGAENAKETLAGNPIEPFGDCVRLIEEPGQCAGNTGKEKKDETDEEQSFNMPVAVRAAAGCGIGF